MSLVMQGRWVFVFSVGGLGVMESGALGCTGSEGRVFPSFRLPALLFHLHRFPFRATPPLLSGGWLLLRQ